MILIHTRKIGGGYIEAFFNGRAVDLETGLWRTTIERVFGGGMYPELDLLKRLRVRFPNQPIRLQPVS